MPSPPDSFADLSCQQAQVTNWVLQRLLQALQLISSILPTEDRPSCHVSSPKRPQGACACAARYLEAVERHEQPQDVVGPLEDPEYSQVPHHPLDARFLNMECIS